MTQFKFFFHEFKPKRVFFANSIEEPGLPIGGLAPAPSPPQQTAGFQAVFDRLSAMGQVRAEQNGSPRCLKWPTRAMPVVLLPGLTFNSMA